jgi:hypothetical protein
MGKECGTYDIPIRGELIDSTQRPMGLLKQELGEPDDETQGAYISILCRKDIRR